MKIDHYAYLNKGAENHIIRIDTELLSRYTQSMEDDNKPTPLTVHLEGFDAFAARQRSEAWSKAFHAGNLP